MIADPGDGWARLSPRKLFLDPVKALGQFLVPGLIAIVGISSGDSSGRFWPFIVAAMVLGPILFGLLPWFTTHYRRTDTQFQLRSGWLNKKSSTAALDRIRSVDLEATLMHRILGLEKVQIGTGVDDERITLDALAREDAQRLRTELLRKAAPLPTEAYEVDAPAAALPVEPAPQVLASIDWSWLKYAPLSLARLVVVAGAIGVLSQFGDELPIWNEETARSTWEWITQITLAVVIPLLVVGAIVGWLVLSISGYIVQWWNFRLSRERGSLHLTHGLFTTKSVSVDEDKVRGVELTEPFLMQPVRGAELHALTTGLEDGLHAILPACPLEVAESVGQQVLSEPEPLTVPLQRHSFRARRRSWIRHADGLFLIPLLLIWPFWYFDLSWAWWAVIAISALALGVGVGDLAYRHLGHTLTREHLVAGSGSLARVRTALETDGIIGWNITQSWWQRRGGLANLVATTAAGAEWVQVTDIDLPLAVALADAATPGLLTPFLDTPER